MDSSIYLKPSGATGFWISVMLWNSDFDIKGFCKYMLVWKLVYGATFSYSTPEYYNDSISPTSQKLKFASAQKTKLISTKKVPQG